MADGMTRPQKVTILLASILDSTREVTKTELSKIKFGSFLFILFSPTNYFLHIFEILTTH